MGTRGTRRAVFPKDVLIPFNGAQAASSKATIEPAIAAINVCFGSDRFEPLARLGVA
jgi:hypothetical protein